MITHYHSFYDSSIPLHRKGDWEKRSVVSQVGLSIKIEIAITGRFAGIHNLEGPGFVQTRETQPELTRGPGQSFSR